MKAKFYLLAGLGTMMLGACSNDDVPNNNSPEVNGGEGKILLDLKFVGNETSRIGGETPEAGSDEESVVKNAYVYYFSSETGNAYLGESQATIIEQEATGGTGDGHIERTVEATVPATVVSSLLKDDDATAEIIVVLNRPENVTLAENSPKDYEAFNAALSGLADDAGFMMSSSFYDHDTKTSDQVKDFTAFNTISKVNIAKEGAGAKPEKVEVYVERVCSKVTLSKKEGSLETPSNAKVDLKDWGLNVKNKKVYPVKQLTSEFMSLTTSTWPGADDWNGSANQRTYWAVDPNYSGEGHTDDFTIINFKDLKTKSGGSEYCLENTFANTNQDRDESTTAVIYAQYTPLLDGATGETAPTEHVTWIMANNKFYSLNTFVGNFLRQQNVYKKDDSGNSYIPATGDDVAFTYTPIKDGNVENSQTIGGEDYKLAAKTEDAVTLYIYKGTGPVGQAQETDFTELKDDGWVTLNTAFTTYTQSAKIYIDGYCYYEIPIRHFYDNEVPLATEDNDADNVVNDETQLGRYGVVRNHWYKLTINKILNPGKPIDKDPITPETGPDDPSEKYYMDVTIKVLKWAVRHQDVDL